MVAPEDEEDFAIHVAEFFDEIAEGFVGFVEKLEVVGDIGVVVGA